MILDLAIVVAVVALHVAGLVTGEVVAAVLSALVSARAATGPRGGPPGTTPCDCGQKTRVEVGGVRRSDVLEDSAALALARGCAAWAARASPAFAAR